MSATAGLKDFALVSASKDDRLQDIQTAHFTYTSDNQVESNTRAFGTPEARTTAFTYTAR